MTNGIPIKVKKECCRLREEGRNSKQIYNEYYKQHVESPCSYNSFRRRLFDWSKTTFPDETTLECGTYEGFTAHGATVQVSKTGEIVQAWIRQSVNDFLYLTCTGVFHYLKIIYLYWMRFCVLLLVSIGIEL